MNLAKKLGYLVLALGIGVTGIHEFRSYKKIKDLQEYSTELKSQQDILSKNLSELEEKLNFQYQNQDALKLDLENLAVALREENLSQENKINLLNKYSAAVRLVLNRENNRLSELTKKDETLANLVNELDLKVEEVIAKTYEPGNTEMIEKIIKPTIEVDCALEVGSGTIIYSKQENKVLNSYILTALHVVEGARDGAPINIKKFSTKGNIERAFTGRLIDYNESIDLAVLKINSDEQFSSAKLISRNEIEQIQRFDTVYTAGCPLGYSPIQTAGEITLQDKELEGISYWMINAQTIFGNSGGGVYSARTNELLGVLSRVAAYNNFVNIAVPHMGIVVPPDKIYEWLESSNLQFLYDENVSRQDCFERREQAKRKATEHK